MSTPTIPTHHSTTDGSVAYVVARNYAVVVFRISEDGPEYQTTPANFDILYEAVNAHEAEVDARIADASVAYAKAAQNAAWWHKHFRTQHDGAAKAAQAAAERDAALLALDTVNAEYEGWSRFFLVQASNGHIHRSMNCSTCFLTTQYAWLPALSGLTEAQAVNEYGGILCSVCFPSAPSEWTTGVNKKDEARKAAEAALKAIAKSPEGKAVIGKRELVRKHQYSLDSLDRQIDAPARAIRMAKTYGDKDITLAEVDPATIAQAEAAAARRVAVGKKLDKAFTQLADAEDALNLALGACPQGHERDDEGMCECDTTPLLDREGHPADDPRHLTSDRF